MQKGGLRWDVFWVDFALVGWAIAATVGVGFVGPELGRIDRAAQQFGPDSAEVGRRVKRLFTIFRFDTALLDPDRARHDREAVQLNGRSGPERKSLPWGGLFRLTV